MIKVAGALACKIPAQERERNGGSELFYTVSARHNHNIFHNLLVPKSRKEKEEQAGRAEATRDRPVAVGLTHTAYYSLEITYSAAKSQSW